MKKLIGFCSALALFASVTGPALAKEISPAQKTEIEAIVREYLINNPEILREMSEKLDEQQRQAEDAMRIQALKQNAAAMFQSPADPLVGNAKGSAVVVEFMDYNCGWCKRAVGEVSQLVEKDKDLKVIFKEFPIFGEDSEYAARAALASTRQGKYWELHRALYAHEGKVTAEVTDQLAAKVGMDVDKLKKDMEDPAIQATLAANRALGQSLGLSGTPAFVIDSTVIPQYVTIDVLEGEIAKVRKAGCQFC